MDSCFLPRRIEKKPTNQTNKQKEKKNKKKKKKKKKQLVSMVFISLPLNVVCCIFGWIAMLSDQQQETKVENLFYNLSNLAKQNRER